MNSIDPYISSAEMTAYWRSLLPKFSHDSMSQKLASPLGIAKAHEFEKRFDYQLIGRHISIRDGFIFGTASRLLSANKYDACISLASGFSLLNYYLAEKHNTQNNIDYIDTDLPHMIAERQQRIEKLADVNILSRSVLTKLKMNSLDLEDVCKRNISLKKLFPNYCNPLFIIEGVIYFLSNDCVSWLIDNIASFQYSACIFDYWPEDGITSSQCFKRVVDSLHGFIPESIKSFWSKEQIKKLNKKFSIMNDDGLADIEKDMSTQHHEPSLFIDQDTFFPVKFVTAEK